MGLDFEAALYTPTTVVTWSRVVLSALAVSSLSDAQLSFLRSVTGTRKGMILRSIV